MTGYRRGESEAEALKVEFGGATCSLRVIEIPLVFDTNDRLSGMLAGAAGSYLSLSRRATAPGLAAFDRFRSWRKSACYRG